MVVLIENMYCIVYRCVLPKEGRNYLRISSTLGAFSTKFFLSFFDNLFAVCPLCFCLLLPTISHCPDIIQTLKIRSRFNYEGTTKLNTTVNIQHTFHNLGTDNTSHCRNVTRSVTE